jgi:GT2 family glycosyltransferase
MAQDHRLGVVKKFSIVIPYKNRLNTLRVVFSSLAGQTMDRSDVEVVVGAMEYSTGYVELCREYGDRLDVVSVLTAEDWSVGRARNLGLRNAVGQVVMTLDADVVLPPAALDDVYHRYFAHGQRVCVAGQIVGYQDAMAHDVDVAEVQPWESYRQTMADLVMDGERVWDYRWSAKYGSALRRFPWAFVSTGLVAVPQSVVQEHDLRFDEGFRGWGPEDQEWAFRIARAGIPILHAQSLYGMHLPHPRDVTANDATAWANNRYYLAKWPRLDLELALSFGWLGADACYAEVEQELSVAAGRQGQRLGTVRGTIEGRDALAVGALVDTDAHVPEAGVARLFDAWSRLEVLPLAGFSLPYEDKTVGEVHVLDPVTVLSQRYRDAIVREAGRISDKVVIL